MDGNIGNIYAASATSVRRQKLRISLKAGAGLFIALLALSACSGSPSASAPPDSGAEVTSITIAYAAPVANHMLPTVTAAEGYFTDQGLEVEVKYLQAAQILPALVAGEVQLATFAAPGYQIPSLSGSPIKAVATWQDSFNALLVSAPPYPTIESLDGKSVAISAPGVFSDLLANMAMQEYDIELTKVPVGSLPNVVSALSTGSVDSATGLGEHHLPAVEQTLPGVHSLIDFREYVGLPGLSLIGYEPWLTEHPRTVENVLIALNAGFDFYKSNRDSVIATIAAELGTSSELAAVDYDGSMTVMADTLEPKVEYEQAVLKYLVRDFPVAEHFDAESLIDASFYQAALGGNE